MIIFDGEQLAARLEQDLIQQVGALDKQGTQLKIAAILFTEDSGSQLYTQLKSEAAARVGIGYQVHEFSLRAGTAPIEAQLAALNQDPNITGVIIQKPTKKTWLQAKGVARDSSKKDKRRAFNAWWSFLTTLIDLKKDVDGLHPQTLSAIEKNTRQPWQLLPATARGVMAILEKAFAQLHLDKNQQSQLRFLVLGRSDIVGQPVFYELKNRGLQVEMLGREEIKQRLMSCQKTNQPLAAEVIISATGVKHLLRSEGVAPGSIVIDVGEPRPDVDFPSIQAQPPEKQPAFITPVPGGVGPMTVVSLLENCLALATFEDYV